MTSCQGHGLGEAAAQLGAAGPAVADIDAEGPKPCGQLCCNGQVPHTSPVRLLDGHAQLAHQVVNGVQRAVYLGNGQDPSIIVLGES